MVSLTGQIFGTGHSKDRSRPVKTDQKQVNWKWSHVPWSGFWDRSQSWVWLTGRQNCDHWKPCQNRYRVLYLLVHLGQVVLELNLVLLFMEICAE